jgi:phospholipase C
VNQWLSKAFFLALAVLAELFLIGCQGLKSGPAPTPAPSPTQLTVATAGSGTGTVTSAPSGISCGTTCTANFPSGSSVTLTAAPTTGFVFTGWSGACSGTATCSVTINAATSVTATFSASLQSLNHIIVLAQENRSFDNYFGAMLQYWAQNGYPAQPFDGLPQFNNPPGLPPTNPGCDPAFPFDPTANPPLLNDCMNDPSSPAVTSFHYQTMCVENPSPSWNESHTDWNLTNPVDPNPTLDGFVHTAAHDARTIMPPFFDVDGLRAMGYYDGNDLNYYYYMASNFATSDRWFSPVMSRTPPNREFLIAGTSQGHAYPLINGAKITSPIIFQELQNAGVTWKIYIHPGANGLTDPASLYTQSYIQNFTYGPTILASFPQNIVSTTQFLTDAQNGTLPQFAFIEPASAVGLDEHPADTDPLPGVPPCCSVQAGAAYVKTLVDAVMTGPNWKDSAFILTFDEFGGFYDHVPPQPAVSPDGIPPNDLLPGDICTVVTGPNCDFTYTGYRIPLLVISPYSKKNFVSHTVADTTAILKLVETRFNVPALTARDAAQIDMSTEFFDFVNAPWVTPPTPPAQNRTGACYLDHLP